jgi:fructosamine-3-kinase
VIEPQVQEAIELLLETKFVRVAPVSGGDINEAFSARLADGRRIFVKTNAQADPAMFPTEASGLRWLAEAGRLCVPRVIAVSSGRAGEPAFLVLEFLRSAPRRSNFDEELGRGLAEMHRFGAPGFGLDYDNFIGRLPQNNGPRDTWPEFYRERRLEPQLRLALDGGRVPPALAAAFDRLFTRLAELVGPAEPVARLHGDLWGGNLHVDERGAPCLIDPAVYGGHREVDLAMMKLFGGFGPRVFAAYDEAHALAAGHAERVLLYQLYPLLVHVNLFGGGYAGQVKQALTHYT